MKGEARDDVKQTRHLWFSQSRVVDATSAIHTQEQNTQQQQGPEETLLRTKKMRLAGDRTDSGKYRLGVR